MKLGILGTSSVAFRRFLPALMKRGDFEYAGVASRRLEKTKPFAEAYGGKGYDGYDALLEDGNIGAVYIPLPPALHYRWGKKALERGKHVLMEKPFATKLEDTEDLLRLAEEKGLAVHENYMFLYHSQLGTIKKIVASGELGETRLVRAAFGFPKRAADDFRYNKELGGGALLDCGGYPVRLALELLGDTARVTQARLCRPRGYDVDLYGGAVLENDDGLCAQISFGMDNCYKCELEVWGSAGTLIAPRVFTAGADFKPKLILRSSTGESVVELEADDQFLHSIEAFARCVKDKNSRIKRYAGIESQARIVEAVRKGGEKA